MESRQHSAGKACAINRSVSKQLISPFLMGKWPIFHSYWYVRLPEGNLYTRRLMSIPTQRMIDIGNLGGPQHSNRNAACNPEKKNHGKCRSTSHRMWYTQETNPTWGWFILGFFHVPNGSKFSNRFQRDVIQKWTSGNQVTNFRSHRRPWLRFFSPLQSNQTSCNGKSTIYR